MPAFLPAPRPEELAQGDILESVEFFRPIAQSYRNTVWRPGIVVSHSCDFTKFKTEEARGRDNLDRFPLLVAPVSPPGVKSYLVV